MTGIFNRGHGEKMISGLLSEQKAGLFCLFDVDKFKNVNDTYGHLFGDVCLEKIAIQIRHVYGKYGTCYRIGGDEFCVIMQKNIVDIDIINNHFQQAVESLQQSDQRIPQVAYGYAYYDMKSEHIQKIIEQADTMMYQNKHT